MPPAERGCQRCVAPTRQLKPRRRPFTPSMPLTELDTARAQYLWALHRHVGAFEAQLADLGCVLDVLVRAEQERRCTAPGPAGARPPLRLLLKRPARPAA